MSNLDDTQNLLEQNAALREENERLKGALERIDGWCWHAEDRLQDPVSYPPEGDDEHHEDFCPSLVARAALSPTEEPTTREEFFEKNAREFP